MRAMLSHLTRRGRLLLGAGIAGVIASLILGQRDLMRVGVLLVAPTTPLPEVPGA
mgnify:CR=1 FL=1